MKKLALLFLLTIISIQVSVLQAQLNLSPKIIAGPTLSNVVTRWNKVPVFSANQSPFFSVNYLVGASVETKLRNRTYLSSDLFFERISNASEGFNKVVTEDNDIYNYVNISIGLSIEPIKERDYRLDFGLIGSYEVVTRGIFRSFGGAIFTGIQLPITEKLSFRTRMSYGIPDIDFSTSSIVSSFPFEQSIRTVSFQFTFGHKI